MPLPAAGHIVVVVVRLVVVAAGRKVVALVANMVVALPEAESRGIAVAHCSPGVLDMAPEQGRS